MNCKHISLLGSTGSVGRQALEVIGASKLEIVALTANAEVQRMEEQARQYHPRLVAMADQRAASELCLRLADTGIRVVGGEEGLLEAALLDDAELVLVAVSGVSGLAPTLEAIRAGKVIALANKETLVSAGELVMAEAERCGATILPVDSEHSAIFQCLQGNRDRGEVKRLILTASGGPFFGWDRARLKSVTLQQALRHPNWSMGPKITIDSATLMNKGLEVIEAVRLYHMAPEKISVIIHRESIIHSMVEYCDNAILAQMGAVDMRLPIQYALTWPARTEGLSRPLDLLTCPPLTFAPPDLEAFPCLRLALEAVERGGMACAVLCGANEEAVNLFLKEKIGFMDIPKLVSQALDTVPQPGQYTLEDILTADRLARESVLRGAAAFIRS